MQKRRLGPPNAMRRPSPITVLKSDPLDPSSFLIVLAVVTLLLTAHGQAQNVILLMSDDQGYGDASYQGHPTLKTPHLDAMAANGVRFDRFYSASPVCSPTRGSCLTGRHPHRYGILGANVGHLPEHELTLAELLKARGYRTGHFGKWHLGTLTKTEREANRGGPRGEKHYAPPWDHGFEVCFSTEAKVPTYDPLLRPLVLGPGQNRWWDPISPEEEATAYGTNYWTRAGRVTSPLRGDDSRLIMDRALPFLRESVAQSRPFFAVIWFHAPHLPVVAGQEHTKAFADADPYRRNFFGSITALDEQVGRLRRELRDLKVAKNTMVWFASDNGPEGNDDAPGTTRSLRGRKRSLYEGGIRVPGLLEWPGGVAIGKVLAIPATTSDYLPTVLAALGVAMPDARPLDGVDLLPILRGEIDRRTRPIAFEIQNRIAMIDNNDKVIGEAGKPLELYDLLSDPNETTNVAAKRPERVARLSAQLAQWRESCKRSLAQVPQKR